MNPPARSGSVSGLSRSPSHRFSKEGESRLSLSAGLGVVGDCHAGQTVQHLSRVRRDPGQPNLRQVHLIHAELYDELAALGFQVSAGQLGENITTRGLDLLGLPRGARLAIGAEVVLEVTGLRNPCLQIERFQPGLLSAVLRRDDSGGVVRKAGVMSIVLVGGDVRRGDVIGVDASTSGGAPLTPV